MNGLMRHIEAAQNVTLPGNRLPLYLSGGDGPGAARVGWVPTMLAADLCRLGCLQTASGLVLEAAAGLPALAAALAREGRFGWRGEPFDVRDDRLPDGPVLSTIDRGALPLLGIVAQGVHVNGLVRRSDGLHLWVGKRAHDTKMEPGKLDHVVAGGTAAGHTPMQTLIKEAAEEAGIPAGLAGRAVFADIVAYDMLRAEGLRRDRLHCFDLDVPEDFIPVPQDGEVENFTLWPIEKVLEAVRDTDSFKFNVNLVLIDLFLRTGAVDPLGAEGQALRARLAYH